jgi:hypothetical protein
MQQKTITKRKKRTVAKLAFCNSPFLLHKENHQPGWWFQKALAMPSPAAAESLPCAKGGGKNL